MLKNYIFKPLLLTAAALFGQNQLNAQTSFNYTGSVQYYTVPTGVTNLCIDAQGAQGGNGTDGAAVDTGGKGGRVVCNLAVTAGQVLNIYVGGSGLPGTFGTSGVAGGYNGGAPSVFVIGGSGGGATDIRTGGTALSNRVIVAGGGGGGGEMTPGVSGTANGGPGGGLNGGNGFRHAMDTGTVVGRGGTQTAGGAGGTFTSFGSPGTLGAGGNGAGASYSGGGGGGYYGGGGGSYSGGGGGSSFTDASLVAYVTHTRGYKTGNGLLVINTSGCLSPIYGAASVCLGGSTPLSNTFTGGTWTSSNPAVATINTSTGVLTGVSLGTTAVSYTDGSNIVTLSKTVTTCPTLNTTTMAPTSGTTVYPNPVTDLLTVKFYGVTYTSYTVCDMVGKIVLQNVISNPVTEISTNSLPAGLYIISLKGTDGNYVQKFVKQD